MSFISSLFGTPGNLVNNLFNTGATLGVTQGAQKGVQATESFLGQQSAEIANETVQKDVANQASMIAATIAGSTAVQNMKFIKDMNDMRNATLGSCGSSMKAVGQNG